MADKNKNAAGSDWTAGIVAIVAALLLGGGIPVGLLYGLYFPKVKEREGEEARMKEQEQVSELLGVRLAKVEKLESEAKEMRERLIDIEKPFSAPNAPEVIEQIDRLAQSHNLGLIPERRQMLRARIVYAGAESEAVSFAQGLNASCVWVDAFGTYHDFGRFLTALETMPGAVVICESLDCYGDQSGSTLHTFRLKLFVIERRDVDKVGT